MSVSSSRDGYFDAYERKFPIIGCAMECSITSLDENSAEETWADTGSEWIRLADNRHLDIYKLFENHISSYYQGKLFKNKITSAFG